MIRIVTGQVLPEKYQVARRYAQGVTLIQLTTNNLQEAIAKFEHDICLHNVNFVDVIFFADGKEVFDPSTLRK